MQSQGGRYGFQVYIFHGDAERMRMNPSTEWSLFGLWTHSSSPVVQYVCESGYRSDEGKVKSLGIELIGHCIDASPRGNHRTWARGRHLIIYNHGNRLEPVLMEERSGLSPVRNCFIKELPMESPFRSCLHGSRSNARATSHRARERNNQGREETVECETNEYQWYATSAGTEKLRRIRDCCLKNLSQKVDINRDPSTHDVQLSIEHEGKTFFVDFPSDFPTRHAQMSYTNVWNLNAAVQRNERIYSEKDIVSAIRKYCGCYRCKYNN